MSHNSDSVKQLSEIFCPQCLVYIRTKPFHLIHIFYVITSKTRYKQCSQSDLNEKKQFITILILFNLPILTHSKDL